VPFFLVKPETQTQKRLPGVFSHTRKHVARRSRLSERGSRFYNPSLGRWLNRDPIGERGGLNVYVAVGNRTADRVDPMGLWGYEQQVGGFTQTTDEDGNVKTTIMKCNIVIFLGHNGRVPQGSIGNEHCSGCSAGAVYACGGLGDFSPGVPETSIPDAPPQTDDSALALGADLIVKGTEAFEKAKMHAKTICNDTKKCCDKVDISVWCDSLLDTRPLLGAFRAVCSLKHTEKCQR
jgi:RHS repeat-associated protein